MKNKARINKKLDAVINHVHDGIIYINQQEEIKVFNEMAEKIFEMNVEDVIDREVKKTIPNTKLDEVLRKEIKHINALQNIGDKKIVSTRVPVKEDGEVVGALATFKDVTDIKELEEDLRRKLKKKGYIAKYNFSDIVGESQELKKAIKKAKKLSKSESTILIQGESGTGKELFAQSIHNYSERSKAPFVVINCAALPDNLLESELFGYEEGAFTGAKKGGKPGVFEQAHTGTIFLDEIGDISPSIQSRLLRVLQEKEVMRVGGTKVIPIDIRVITATNRDIQRLVEEGEFREDLYYRLNVLSLQLPSLRKRREDIPLLIEHFLKEFGRKNLSLSKEVMSRLYNYDWNGNVREVENCIEYIVQVCEDNVEIEDLPSHFNFRQEDQKQEKKEIEFKLEELGDIEEYIFILNELYLAKQLGDNIGRREISKNAEINNLYLSSQMVRSRLNKLEEQDLVNIGKGRQGTNITKKGIKVLKELTN
nr:sigma 54-interacting transcriptional regulator [Sporohalobacter salinus]